MKLNYASEETSLWDLNRKRKVETRQQTKNAHGIQAMSVLYKTQPEDVSQH